MLRRELAPSQHDRLHHEVPLVPASPEPVASFVLNYFDPPRDTGSATAVEGLTQLVKASRYEGNDLTGIELAITNLSIEAQHPGMVDYLVSNNNSLVPPASKLSSTAD